LGSHLRSYRIPVRWIDLPGQRASLARSLNRIGCPQRSDGPRVVTAVNDDARAVEWAVCTSKRRNHAIAATLDGAQVDEENLILAVVDDFAQQMTAARQITACKLALEY
jgi:hypothetical protein